MCRSWGCRAVAWQHTQKYSIWGKGKWSSVCLRARYVVKACEAEHMKLRIPTSAPIDCQSFGPDLSHMIPSFSLHIIAQQWCKSSLRAKICSFLCSRFLFLQASGMVLTDLSPLVLQSTMHGGWKNMVALPIIEQLTDMPIIHTWNESVMMWEYHTHFNFDAVDCTHMCHPSEYQYWVYEMYRSFKNKLSLKPWSG